MNESKRGFSEGLRKRLMISIFSLCLILLSGSLSFGQSAGIPFQPGEKLNFAVSWAFVPAGEATLEILPHERKNGVDCFHFRATAKTLEYVDILYRVRDTIDGYTDMSMTRSVLFTKLQQGKSKRNVVVDFDWDKREACYANFGEKIAPLAIEQGTFDPLSIFYAFRSHELREGTELTQSLTDGKRTIISTARVIRREKIEVRGKSYDTFLVEPEMKNIGGLFEKSENSKLQIWVTADERRIPVRIKSAVTIGSFVAELTSWEQGG